eukprot:SAG31_NODE_3446_length_4259_cov_3.747115_5_plen_213_part_00
MGCALSSTAVSADSQAAVGNPPTKFSSSPAVDAPEAAPPPGQEVSDARGISSLSPDAIQAGAGGKNDKGIKSLKNIPDAIQAGAGGGSVGEPASGPPSEPLVQSAPQLPPAQCSDACPISYTRKAKHCEQLNSATGDIDAAEANVAYSDDAVTTCPSSSELQENAALQETEQCERVTKGPLTQRFSYMKATFAMGCYWVRFDAGGGVVIEHS